jgi:hypothetical protein
VKHYKLTQEDLEDFAKKVYEEACYGYLDLKDSVCVGLVSTFLEGKTIADTHLNTSPFSGASVLNMGNNTVSIQPGANPNHSLLGYHAFNQSLMREPHPVPSLPPLILPPVVQQELLNGNSILNEDSNLSGSLYLTGSTVRLNRDSVVLVTQDQEQESRPQTTNSNFESERFIYG